MLQQRSDEKLKIMKRDWPKHMKKCAAFLAALWVICTLFTGVSASDWDCSGFVGALFGEFPFSRGEQLPAEPETLESLPVFHQILVEGQGSVGLLLERTDAARPSFSLESLERPEECAVTMETVGDTLHITVKAAVRKDGVSIVYEEGRRLNVVQVLLPDREYAAFAVKTRQNMGLCVQDFSAPMSITTENGPVQLRDSRLARGSCSLKVDCGPVSIQADTIQKEIAAVVTKGPISVDADTIGGGLKLQVTDGPVSVEADTIQKKLDIQVGNGPASVEAGTIGELELQVTNGPVSIEAAVIEGDVTVDAANGPLVLQFEQEPANLYLDASGCERAARLKLPDGWSTVYQAGNGLPRVTLSCKNGPAVVKVQE